MDPIFLAIIMKNADEDTLTLLFLGFFVLAARRLRDQYGLTFDQTLLLAKWLREAAA